MKRYSSREKTLIRLVILVVVYAVGQEAYDRYAQSKADLILKIQSESEAQALYLQKLDIDKEALLRSIERFDAILDESKERVLRMTNESEALFKVQEDLARMGENAQINMNSQNRRKSRKISEEDDLIELRTYFGFDCQLENLLEFFDALQTSPHYLAIDTLNVNSYTRRRRRRRAKTDPPNANQDKIRGSAVISTLYAPGSPDDPIRGTDESKAPEPSEPSESEEIVTTAAGETESTGPVDFKPSEMETLPNLRESVKQLGKPSESVLRRALPERPQPLTHSARPIEKSKSKSKDKTSIKF